MSEKEYKPMSWIPVSLRQKLAIMAVCIVVLVGGMFFLADMARKNKAAAQKQADQQAQQAQAAAAEEKSSDETAENLASLKEDTAFAEMHEQETEDFDLFDMELLKEAGRFDRSTGIPPVGLVLLLHKAQQRTFDQIIAETNDAVSLENVIEAPAENRGKLLYVEGSLNNAVKKKMYSNAAGVKYVYEGTMDCPQVDSGTQKVHFFLLDGPLGSKVGEKVELRGYFLSLWKDEDGTVMPILVGRRFDPPTWLTDPKSLQNVYEGDFNREYKAVYYLMNQIQDMSKAEIRKAVDNDIKANDLSTAPVKNRGKFISVFGTIIRLRQQPLDPNPTGISKCYEVWLLDPNENRYMAYVLERPENLKENDLARLDGIFLKNYRYITRKNLEELAPVIVAKSLRPARVSTVKVDLQTLAICAIVLLIVGIAAIFEIRSSRRRLKESHRQMLSRMPKDIGERARSASSTIRRESKN